MAEIKRRNKEYWQKREEAKASRWFATEGAQIRKKNRLYDKAIKDMDKEINAFYAKYGKIVEAPVVKQVGSLQLATDTKKQLVVTMQEANKRRGKVSRLQWLQMQLNDMIKPLYGEQKQQLVDYLSDVAKENYFETIFEAQRGIGVGSSFKVINEGAISQLIRTPIKGANFSQRYTINRNKLAQNVNQILTDGMIKGVSNQTMIKDLTNRMEIDKKSASRIIRTELTNTYNQSNLAGYIEGGVVKNYEYIATLDNRTSEVCTELDGQTFPVDKATPGLNYPPMHPNCRSTTAISIDNQEYTRIARSLDGKKTFTVPATMTAKDWKRKYVK